MSLRRREPEELEGATDLATAMGQLRAKSLLCPKPEMLQAARSGVLPSQLAERVTRHLEDCRLCQSVVEDLEALDSVDLDTAGQTRIWKQVQVGISGEETSPSARRPGTSWRSWFRPAPLAVLGTAAIILVAGILFLRDRKPPPVSLAQGHPPALPVMTNVLQLEKAPVVLPESAAIIWRGQPNQAERQAVELKQALAPYEADNYADAARRLRRLRKKYPRMAEAPFYLGVSELFLNQNEDATMSFKDAIGLANQPLSDQAKWYLALSLYRTGRNDLASSLLEAVCRTGRKNSDRACAGVKELQVRH